MSKDKADVKSAGDAGNANKPVQVKCNPRLRRGCSSQVVVKVDGRVYAIGSEPMEVTAALAEKMTAVEVRGVAAVVRA